MFFGELLFIMKINEERQTTRKVEGKKNVVKTKGKLFFVVASHSRSLEHALYIYYILDFTQYFPIGKTKQKTTEWFCFCARQENWIKILSFYV
jgi:predicted dithiol-disulfide oxidoreductase (DUF899 family)